MESKYKTVFFFVLIVFPACTLAHFKKCVPYCGADTGVSCPSNYTCSDWDSCGPSCIRGPGYQPDHCPLIDCLPNYCPLGFAKYGEEGCEGCDCIRVEEAIEIEKRGAKESVRGTAAAMFINTPILMTVMNPIFVQFCV